MTTEYQRLTATQAARRVSAGERLEYVIEWSAGWYGGSDVLAFEPDTADVDATNIAHRIKCAQFDRNTYRIIRRGWRAA